MEKETDVLDEIFVDRNEPADKTLIVSILKGYATIDGLGTINYSSDYDRLVGHKKILVYLCCKKAMILKGIKGISESSSQSEVSKGAMVTLDVARNALHKKYKKILGKEEGGYIIPNYYLKEVHRLLKEEKNG